MKKFLCFYLDSSEYALEIIGVEEVSKMIEITPLPHRADFLAGVVNLRGRIVAVMEVRKFFNLPEKEINKETKIIIAKNGSKEVGLLVDWVSGVRDIAEEKIEPVPATAEEETKYLAGVIQLPDHPLNMLSLEKLFDSETLNQFKTRQI